VEINVRNIVPAGIFSLGTLFLTVISKGTYLIARIFQELSFLAIILKRNGSPRLPRK
jgi:hypothetical protein